MKKLSRYIFSLLLLCIVCLLNNACTDTTTGLGKVPTVSEDLFTIEIDAENSNLVHFIFKGEKMSPYWEVKLPGSSLTSSKPSFTLTLNRGTYDGTLRVYDRNGVSEKYPFTFTVVAIDPALVDLIGENDDKIWVWDRFGAKVTGGNNDQGGNRIFGYVWGEPWQDNCWYLGIDDFADMQNMDDELSFHANGSFVLEAHNTVWVDGGGFGDVEGSGVTTWTPAGTETWTVFEDNGKRYLQFDGGGFPSIVASAAAVNARYEIAELSANCLRLRYWVSEEEYTEFNFIPKGYEPEEQPDPEEPENPEEIKLSPLDTDSPEVALLTGKTWKLGPRYGYNYGEDDLYEVPEDCVDDKLLFMANNTMSFDTGASNQAYTDDGFTTYIPSGKEKWILGRGEDEKLYLRFRGGGFPIIRPNLPGINLTYEVIELTANTLKLNWPYGDGGYFVTILVASN